jgi:hypothetical protein
MDLEGYWKVVSLPDLVDDYLEMTEGPHVELARDGDGYSGKYHFGAQDGQIRGIVEKVGGVELFVFSFIGSDDGTEESGGGTARLKGKNKLTGTMVYHYSDALRFEWERS